MLKKMLTNEEVKQVARIVYCSSSIPYDEAVAIMKILDTNYREPCTHLRG